MFIHPYMVILIVLYICVHICCRVIELTHIHKYNFNIIQRLSR